MADLRPQWNEEAVGANHPTKDDVINRAWNVEHEEDGTHKVLYTAVMPKVNAAVNKLDIFAKSSGALPDATHIISDLIPDGSGASWRYRAGAVAGGNGQIILADGQNYWGKGSLDAEIKTAYLYAIWSAADAGIVWALGGYSGFTQVPTTTTVTDDDYFLLEDGSTYTRVATDYCVAVARIRYQYDTADAPDHTIQATVENAPKYTWNPKSDYAGRVTLASNVVSAGDIAAASQISRVLKQAGRYEAVAQAHGISGVGATLAYLNGGQIKVGSATYGSATGVAVFSGDTVSLASQYCFGVAEAVFYANNGDTIHLGMGMVANAGNRTIIAGSTSFHFRRID